MRKILTYRRLRMLHEHLMPLLEATLEADDTIPEDQVELAFEAKEALWSLIIHKMRKSKKKGKLLV